MGLKYTNIINTGDSLFLLLSKSNRVYSRIRPKFALNHGNEVEHSQVTHFLVTNILTSQMFNYVLTIIA